jgi:hypothetical protein
VDQYRIPREGIGCRHILEAMAFPQAIGITECRQPAFRRDSGTCQDHHAWMGWHAIEYIRLPAMANFHLDFLMAAHASVLAAMNRCYLRAYFRWFPLIDPAAAS